MYVKQIRGQIFFKKGGTRDRTLAVLSLNALEEGTNNPCLREVGGASTLSMLNPTPRV